MNLSHNNSNTNNDIYTSKTSKTYIFSFIVAGIVIIWTNVYLDLLAPQYLSDIMTEIHLPNRSMNNIWRWSIYMMTCVFASMITSIACAILVGRFSTTVTANMRHNVFGKIISLSPQDLKEFSINSLITRSTNDINQIKSLIAIGFHAIIKVPILSIWSCYKIRNMDISWLITIISFILTLLIVVLTVVIIVVPKYDKIQAMVDKLNSVSRDHITGIKVIHAYNAEQYQVNKIKNITEKLTQTEMHTNIAIGFVPQMVAFMLPTITLAIYWVAKHIINSNPASTYKTMSDMMIVNLYSIQLIVAVMMVTFVVMILPKAITSIKRIKEIYNIKPSIVSGISKLGKTMRTNVAIEFRNASFRYIDKGKNVLNNLNIKIMSGSKIAVIGPTGCGKTSFISLIARLYDVQSGQVLVDGMDVKEYNVEDLRNRISFITQKSKIFSGTIKSNVTFGNKDVDSIDIDDILDTANVKSFIKTHDNETAQNGANFSGGQKQRISIARGLARKSEIYIFDDCFSSLDNKTDKIIRSKIDQKLPHDATKIVVTQRITTAMEYDKIIVLDSGRIASSGRHEDLIRECPVYRRICESQNISLNNFD